MFTIEDKKLKDNQAAVDIAQHKMEKFQSKQLLYMCTHTHTYTHTHTHTHTVCMCVCVLSRIKIILQVNILHHCCTYTAYVSTIDAEKSEDEETAPNDELGMEVSPGKHWQVCMHLYIHNYVYYVAIENEKTENKEAASRQYEVENSEGKQLCSCVWVGSWGVSRFTFLYCSCVIIELVDSICRDGADTPISINADCSSSSSVQNGLLRNWRY